MFHPALHRQAHSCGLCGANIPRNVTCIHTTTQNNRPRHCGASASISCVANEGAHRREIRFPELLVLMSSRTHAAQTHNNNNKNVLSLLHVPRRVATVLTPDPFCAAFRYQRRAKETERQSDRQGKTNSRVLIAPLGYQKPVQRRTSTLRHAQAAHQRNNKSSPSAVIRTVEACSAPPRPGLVVRRCASERTQQWVNYAGSHHHTTAAQKNKQNKQQRCEREKQKDRERQQGDGNRPHTTSECISIAVRITGTRHKGVRHSESIRFHHVHKGVNEAKETERDEKMKK